MKRALVTVKSEGRNVQAVENSFWAVVDLWLDYLVREKNKKPRTIATYRYNMKVFKAFLDDNEIEHATREDLKGYKTFMTDKGWGVATRNLYLSTVKSFYSWLSTEHDIPNIAAGLDGWEATKEHKRGTLSTSEMKNLLAIVAIVSKQKLAAAQVNFSGGRAKYYARQITLQALRDKAILATLMAGGLRTIEISRLRICDFCREGAIYYLNVLGKGRDDRELVKISAKAAKIIRDWLDAREIVDIVENDSPLFCAISNQSFGDAITSASVSRLVKNYLRAAGLNSKAYVADVSHKVTVKPIVAHSLRASLATNAFRRGASLDDVRTQLRHRNLATTQIYLDESTKAANPVSDLVANEIF